MDQEKGGQAFSQKVLLVVGGCEEGGHLYLDVSRHTGHCYTQKRTEKWTTGVCPHTARGATIRIITAGTAELRADWGGQRQKGITPAQQFYSGLGIPPSLWEQLKTHHIL